MEAQPNSQPNSQPFTQRLNRTHSRPVKRLDPWVAERIAAGEVIERPSSVVKELLENSLDAGATEVQVDLEDGGKALIRVTDNGWGMSREDLTLAIERHATSKVESLDDLDRIHTLGFRGEALPSIAAATELTIVSRAQAATQADAKLDDATAYLLHPTAKTVEATTAGHFLHSEHGTRIECRGLFSQIPARLKFLKSASAEVSQVREWMERLALAYPQTGFKLTSDERVVLQLRPQTEVERVRAVLSGGEDFPILMGDLPHAKMDLAFNVRAYWIQGLSLPQTRRLVQVVNGRAVRDKTLQQAVLQPFRQVLLPGQFPAIALFVTVPPATLDVNVHPTKTEVRFLDTSKVFRAVQSTVENLIATHGAPSVVPIQSAFVPDPNAIMPLPGMDFKAGFELRDSRTNGDSVDTYRPDRATWTRSADSAPFGDSAVASGSVNLHSTTAEFAELDQPAQFAQIARNPGTPAPLRELLRPELYVGVLFRTYLLYDLESEAVLVDQHAAHERIRYERLKAQVLTGGARDGQAPPAQQLLIPEVVTIDSEELAEVQSALPVLESMGFDCDTLGETAVVFRSVPTAWTSMVRPGAAGNTDLRARLASLVAKLIAHISEQPTGAGQAGTKAEANSGAHLILDESLFEKLASEACHGSVRAGDRLDRTEATHLVNALWDCEHPWNCPHGRPTVVRIPRVKFEEWFQRKVL